MLAYTMTATEQLLSEMETMVEELETAMREDAPMPDWANDWDDVDEEAENEPEPELTAWEDDCEDFYASREWDRLVSMDAEVSVR